MVKGNRNKNIKDLPDGSKKSDDSPRKRKILENTRRSRSKSPVATASRETNKQRKTDSKSKNNNATIDARNVIDRRIKSKVVKPDRRDKLDEDEEAIHVTTGDGVNLRISRPDHDEFGEELDYEYDEFEEEDSGESQFSPREDEIERVVTPIEDVSLQRRRRSSGASEITFPKLVNKSDEDLQSSVVRLLKKPGDMFSDERYDQ